MAQIDLRHATEQAILTQLPLRFTHVEEIGATMRESLRLDAYRDQILDRMVYELNAFVLAEKFVDKRIEKKALFRSTYPSSWWQAFKDEVLDRYWVTKWFVKWRPVDWTVVDYEETLVANFSQYAKYPAADVIVAPQSIHKNIVVHHEMMSWQ